MGKMKKTKPVRMVALPLADQISGDLQVKSSGRQKIRNQRQEDMVVDEKLSRRILEQARIQQDELEEEYGPSAPKVQLKKTSLRGKTQDDDDDDTSSSDDDLDADDYEQNYEIVNVDVNDEIALAKFMPTTFAPRRTINELIIEKINEKKTEIETQFSDPNSLKMPDLDERVVEVFKGVRQILRKYRSGKLPKAFKIIPSLANWEQLLYLTEPDHWTASAMYQATRIFAANLKENMAQRFYNLVLLPRIRDDIDEYKQLNVHLYQALKKSLYKPGAFYKGILLPLCESGTCTLREAIIVGSVMAKNSIPLLHSAAAILKIAEMEYSGGNSIFLRILLDKKYSLPYRVIDSVVFHFLKFQRDKRELPVLWHQALLVFVQRYKEDVSSEQKLALCELLKVHVHNPITQDIRHELQNSKCRDEEVAQPMMDD